MDLRRLITKHVRDAVKGAVAEGKTGKNTGGKTGGTNIAAAINVGKDGASTSVYSDDEVTIVKRDGKTTVTRHGDEKEPGA
jgi:hypothetical protein